MKPTLLALGILLTILSSPAAALTPERLVYDANWGGIKAGTAVMEVTAQGDGFLIVNTIKSMGFVSAFFRIDNRTESSVSREGRPRFFKERIREGKHRAQREAAFDFTNLRADSKDLLQKTGRRDPVTPRTYDNLSSIYFLRFSDLVPGQSIFFEIYDARRLWNVEARAVKRQEISTPVGKFNTIMVTSQLKHDGAPASVGNPTFWFTDDKRRIPVRITTKLRVGEITLTLVGGL